MPAGSGRKQKTQELSAPPPGVESYPLAVARQPILDHTLNVVGYELLFRGAEHDHADIVNAEAATSRVIVDSFMEIGLDDLVGEAPAYINFTREFLMNVRPLPLPPGRVVLELLEDQVVDDALLEVLDELIDDGFTIALDDFQWTDGCEALIERAHTVKIDVLAYDDALLPEIVQRLRKQRKGGLPLLLLAEKVETHADFERCRELGFDAFQGYFYARPTRVENTTVPTHHLGALSAMRQLAATEDFDELDRIITRDVGLSMRLLRYANSAYIYLPSRVASIHGALTMLGTLTVRRWATMVALSGLDDAPHELLVTALVRARMCQLLSGAERETDGEEQFTVGLFSVADALVDAPMEAVIEILPFTREVARALVTREGTLGTLLNTVLAYEQGNFEEVVALGSDVGDVDIAYRRAIKWADGAAGNLI